MAGKVCLQSREALVSSEEDRGRLLINCLLRSMNPKLRGCVAHMVDVKAIQDRPNYWQLVKFTVEKEAKINFDDAKKISKPKATTHFKFDHKKTKLKSHCADGGNGTRRGSGSCRHYAPPDRGQRQSYEASPDDTPVSAGDVEVAVRVAHASEAFSGRCFHCNKVWHCFRDEECEMYNPDF